MATGQGELVREKSATNFHLEAGRKVQATFRFAGSVCWIDEVRESSMRNLWFHRLHWPAATATQTSCGEGVDEPSDAPHSMQ